MKPVYWGHVVSRLRDDAALWYSYDSIRTDKRGRPRIKGEKIDFANLNLQHYEALSIERGKGLLNSMPILKR